MTIREYPKETILVTGGTGFIGAHCVNELLKRNVQVKVACRSQDKFETLLMAIDSTKRSMISHTVVLDISDIDELTAAVKGCTGILHLASPFTYNVIDFTKELLEPAFNGTIRVLEAAISEKRIKRVVITSSFAAVYDASKGLQPGVVLTEKDYSPLTWEDGANTKDPAVAYRASKAIAERAVWNFMDEAKPHFDVTILCPTMVFGPLLSLNLLKNVNQLNFSNQVINNILNLSKDAEIPPTKGPLWVDVRDVAYSHVQALFIDKASNQRYLLSAGDYDNQEVADILRSTLRDEWTKSKVPLGKPGRRLAGSHFTASSNKATTELEVAFRTLDESVLDLADQLLQFNKTPEAA